MNEASFFGFQLVMVLQADGGTVRISYLDKVSFDYLPLLPTGTCIFAGLLANVPIVIDIGRIQPARHEPKNKTITLTDKWD